MYANNARERGLACGGKTVTCASNTWEVRNVVHQGQTKKMSSRRVGREREGQSGRTRAGKDDRTEQSPATKECGCWAESLWDAKPKERDRGREAEVKTGGGRSQTKRGSRSTSGVVVVAVEKPELYALAARFRSSPVSSMTEYSRPVVGSLVNVYLGSEATEKVQVPNVVRIFGTS